MLTDQPVCLVCKRTADQTPLLKLRFRDSDLWICAQDLPILIHKPHELAGKLPDMDLSRPLDTRPHNH